MRNLFYWDMDSTSWTTATANDALKCKRRYNVTETLQNDVHRTPETFNSDHIDHNHVGPSRNGSRR